MDTQNIDRRIDYSRWFWTVFGWDGLLPILTVLLPFVVDWCFPNHPNAIMLLAVFFPIVSFFIRMGVGGHHISQNYCGPRLQVLQYSALILGVFILLLVEAIFIAFHGMPQNVAQDDTTFLAISLGIYLLMMIFAMYPGRSATQSGVAERFDG